MTLILRTERLNLRPFEERDIQPFWQYRSDPEVARYQGWVMPYTLEMAKDFYQQMSQAKPGTPPGAWYQLAIEPIETGQIAGDVAFYLLERDPRQAEIGFSLARPYQGKGYASEALRCLLDYLFFELDLHRVQANCDVENLPSVRLMERAGMRREGQFIENLWFKGRWSSEYWYAILKQEWLQLRQGDKNPEKPPNN
jgi:RimJ/RimL family protein N-acetyltransferase